MADERIKTHLLGKLLFGDWETYYLPQRNLEHRNRLRTKRHKAQKKGQGSSKDSKLQQIML